MALRIVMPSFGMFTAEGKLASWLVLSGARVAPGQPVLEIETDKAIQEVISPASGILQSVAKVGETVREEQLLGYVLAEGEAPPAADDINPAAVAIPQEARSVRPQEGARKRTHEAAGSARIIATPEARRMAARYGIDLSTVEGTGPNGRIVAADVSASIAKPRR